jgi:hypothetical protein
MFRLKCVSKCSNFHMHPQFLSQDNLYSPLILVVLLGAVVPHLERGTAAVRHCRT